MYKFLLSLLGCAMVAHAAVAAITISPSSRSFEFGGGGAIISTSGDGTWSAVSDSDWLTVSIASGNAGKGCAYLVTANNTADVRVGHITVSGNIYTVTQSGRSVDLTPASIEIGAEETSGEITLTTDANVSWTVRSNDGWISVSPATGEGPAVLTYTIQPFDGVGSRSGTITVGSQTVPVTQTGIDVNLTPTVTNVPYTVTLIPVIVDAMAETAWTVKPNATWISVVDPGTGHGGSQVMIAAAENPSFEKRTGTVSIGTGKITVIQDGTSDLSFKILPEVATAFPLGAFGNVAVYATPDATWIAESLADWIHISSGTEGAGNGNVKYVANSNPELTPRTGQIKFTPPAVVPELDLYRGLLFWIKDQTNIEGNETRQTTYPLSKSFDGSFNNPLTGASIPAQANNDFTLSFSFKLGELDCLNRILKLSQHTVYTRDDNKLWYHKVETPLTITKKNVFYSLVVRYSATSSDKGTISVYAGEKDKELTHLFDSKEENKILSLTSGDTMGKFTFGYGTYPSTGYLGSGQIANIRFWTRALTDKECECVDTKQNVALEATPYGCPLNVKYDYFPLGGNWMGTDEGNSTPKTEGYGVSASNWNMAKDRFRISEGALESSGGGIAEFASFNDMFESGYVLNGGKEFSIENMDRTQTISWGGPTTFHYPAPAVSTKCQDGSCCFWVKLNSLPKSGDANIFTRKISENYVSGWIEKGLGYPWYFWYDVGTWAEATEAISKGYLVFCGRGDYRPEFSWGVATNNFQLSLSIASDGRLRLKQVSGFPEFELKTVVIGNSRPNLWTYRFVSKDTTTDSTAIKVSTNEWHCIAMSCKDQKSITLYLDGVECLSVPSKMSFGCLPPCDLSLMWYSTPDDWYCKQYTQHAYSLHVGGWNGVLDEVTFYKRALTTKEVEAIWEEGAPAQYVYHTVTQGVVEPTLSVDSVYMSKRGGNTNVTLTVAKGVNWTVKTSDSWLSVAGDTSGSGPAEFTIKVAANPTIVERVGTVTIAGKTVTVTQEGLACEVVYTNPTFDVGGSMGSITVNPESGGSWTATTDDDWIYIISGESGTGSGDVVFSTLTRRVRGRVSSPLETRRCISLSAVIS